MRDVAITGIASTNFGKHEGRGLESLAAEAASAALSRAGVERRRAVSMAVPPVPASLPAGARGATQSGGPLKEPPL